MTKTDLIDYLQMNHLSEWLKTRKEVENELSNRNGMFCVCGRLATGFHEMNCRKFIKLVTNTTADRLKHLIAVVKPVQKEG